MKYIDIVPFAKIPLTQQQIFTYLNKYNYRLKIGQIVEVPLQNSNVRGVIIKIKKKAPIGINYKTINKLLYPYPIFTPKQIKLARLISHYYYSPLGVVFKTMSPPVLKKIKNNLKVINKHTKNNNKKENFLLLKGNKEWRQKEYFKKIKNCLKNNQQVLYLVPELSQITQILDILSSQFPQIKIVEFCGRLSSGKYLENWISVLYDDAQIILGTRQATFAPFNNLGLIILDEEHNPSFKQWDMNPRYHARKVAEFLVKIYKSQLILGAKSPSIHSFYKAKEEKQYSLKIQKNSLSHKVCIVDMRNEIKSGNFSIFSYKLLNVLENILTQNKQAIIFVNRRAFASFVMCRDCGYIIKCPNCSKALLEYSDGRLVCTHCSYKENMPLTCPKCSSVRIKGFGVGTQRVAKEVTKFFPKAQVEIFDRDHLKRKNDVFKIYQKFDTGQIDVLVGTQPVLTFQPFNLSLIAAINIDFMLNFPSWQSRERTFCLLSELINKKYQTIIQTYNPEHKIFELLKSNNYNLFYKNEIKERKLLYYPPFSQLIKLTFSYKNLDVGRNKFKQVKNNLERYIQENKLPVKLIVPNEATISRRSGKYLNAIILKLPTKRMFSKNKLLDLIPGDWTIDVDPDSL